MKFNTLSSTPATRTIINQFGGYNCNPVIAENEFSDMLNMNLDEYPVMTSKGYKYQSEGQKDDSSTEYRLHFVVEGPTTWSETTEDKVTTKQIGNDILYFIECNMLAPDDGDKYYNFCKQYVDYYGKTHTYLLHETVADEAIKYADGGNATAVQLGGTIYFFVNQMTSQPVVFVYNAIKDEFKKIESKWEIKPTEIDPLVYTFCNEKGEMETGWEVREKGSEEEFPLLPSNGDKVMLKTSEGYFEPYVYSSQYSGWFAYANVFLKLKYEGISEGRQSGDTIYISGVGSKNYADISKQLNGMQQIYSVNTEEDYILIKGIACPEGDVRLSTGTIVFDRKIPRMDYIISHKNRVWGCRYGENTDGDIVNEIYASTLGNPLNWLTYTTESTSSYAATVGENSAFTGAISYGDTPLFFKEQYTYRIYGNFPANYQIVSKQQQGATACAEVIDGVLYYCSNNDICAYDGAYPVSISKNIGYQIGRSANLDGKYAIITPRKVYVYNPKLKLWHIEAAPNSFSYVYKYNGKIRFYGEDGYEIKKEDDVEKWQFTSAKWGLDNPDSKYINRLDIRMQLDGTAEASVEYDSDGQWHHIGTVTGQGLKSFTFPILPRRCDHFRLKLQGKGKVKIFSITKSVKGAGK